MSLLAALAAMPAGFVPPFADETRSPSDGDPAYTIYRGERYVGTLADLFSNYLTPPRGKLLAPADRPFWPGRDDLSVGYDENIVWDVNAGMWYAPADWD